MQDIRSPTSKKRAWEMLREYEPGLASLLKGLAEAGAQPESIQIEVKGEIVFDNIAAGAGR